VIRADAVVVGAGPAGSACALTLARAGLDVVVADRARFPRDKCCGDGLTARALQLLSGLGLEPAPAGRLAPVGRLALRSPSGRQLELQLAHDQAGAARRADLDAWLLGAARSAGARVLEGYGLAGLEAAEDLKVRLRPEGGPDQVVAARFAVGADGVWSPLRKAAGAAEPGRYLGEWHALRQYFGGVGPRAQQAMWVFFEPDLLPGYAWSFPVPGGANVGFGLPRRPGRSAGEMARLWAGLLARPHLREVLGPGARPEGAPRSWPIPARLGRSPLAALGGRVLFVGDAARAADPLTGEGIAQALETGVLAGRAIAAHPDPASAAARYRRELAWGMRLDHAVAAGVSRLLARPLAARGALSAVGRLAPVRGPFSRWVMEDYPRAQGLTPWRWGRGAGAGRAATRR
jgi:geranylgeranyl reductase family protein